MDDFAGVPSPTVPLTRLRMRDDRDRAVRVPMVRMTRLAQVPAWVWSELRHRRGRWRLVGRLVRSGPLWVGLLVAVLLAILVTLLIRDTAVGLGLLIISPVMAPLVSTGLVTARGLIGLGGALPEALRAAFLADGRCVCCLYDLRALRAEPDGCVTCAECGAAWNWDAIGDRGGRDPEVVVIGPATLNPGE